MKASCYKTRKAALGKIYRTTATLTGKLYYDTYWKGVNDIIDALLTEVDEVTTWCENGGYRNNADGTQWKEYKMEIVCGKFTFNAVLNCHAAGSMEDPFDRYDMSLVIW